MPFFNHSTRSVHFKVIYWGAPGAGRRTCVRFLIAQLPPTRGRLDVFGASDTLDAHLAPPSIAPIRGYTVRVDVSALASGSVTPPEGSQFARVVDAVVFVADARRDRRAANREALAALELTSAARAPRVLQLNMQDLPGIASPDEVLADVGSAWQAVVLSCAVTGKGVVEAVRHAVRAPYLAAREHEA
jgi:hypothetical protein